MWHERVPEERWCSPRESVGKLRSERVNLATRRKPARARCVPEGANPGDSGHSYSQADRRGKGGAAEWAWLGHGGCFWGPRRLGLEGQVGLFLGEP